MGHYLCAIGSGRSADLSGVAASGGVACLVRAPSYTDYTVIGT